MRTFVRNKHIEVYALYGASQGKNRPAAMGLLPPHRHDF